MGTDTASPVAPLLDVTLSRRVAGVKQHLADLANSGNAVLGLHGISGIGKTMLARAIFDELRSDFVDCSCFMDVGSGADTAALAELQGAMLSKLCGIDRHVSSVDAGRAELENCLVNARVLLVIDGICLRAQLDALLVTVGQGSRVLVTSQIADLLWRPGIQAIQPLSLLGQSEALELFLLHAQPTPECSDLAASMAEACAGLPQALTDVGGLLRGRQHRKQWEQTLRMLQGAEGLSDSADKPRYNLLRLRYNALNMAEQEMFLDIACLMLGKDARACVPVWGLLAESTLSTLEIRSLVHVDGDGCLAMHDALRVMGRGIVVEEHSQPAQRSRLWMPDSLEAFNSLQVWPSPRLCLPE